MKTMLSGLKLKQAIHAIGINPAELARRCDTTRQTIYNMCEGGTRHVSVDMLTKLKANLRCEDKDLLVTVKD
jgi:DNA-binding Xre family transcriptional regulator